MTPKKKRPAERSKDIFVCTCFIVLYPVISIGKYDPEQSSHMGTRKLIHASTADHKNRIRSGEQ